MILFDTHAHFNVQTPAQEQLERAIVSGFTGILAMGGSAEMNSCAIKLAKEFRVSGKPTELVKKRADLLFSSSKSIMLFSDDEIIEERYEKFRNIKELKEI